MSNSIEETYTLVQPFVYNGTEELSYLTISCPKALHMPIISRMKEFIMSASMKMANMANKVDQDDTVSQDTDSVDGKAFLQAMQAAGDGTYMKFCSEFKSLMCSSNICKINGVLDMKSGWYDMMSITDAESLMGDYLSHFFTL